LNPESLDAKFKIVREILFNRLGEGQAATIGELCHATGLSRRRMEQLLEIHLAAFPFPVISTSAGYFRPASADEINHCLASLQSRAMCIFLRKRTIIRNARAAGYQRQGKRFVQRQFRDDLFAPPDPPPFNPASERSEGRNHASERSEGRAQASERSEARAFA
jgi:hypothetical protein